MPLILLGDPEENLDLLHKGDADETVGNEALSSTLSLLWVQSLPYAFFFDLVQDYACEDPPVSYFVIFVGALQAAECQVDVMPDCGGGFLGVLMDSGRNACHVH